MHRHEIIMDMFSLSKELKPLIFIVAWQIAQGKITLSSSAKGTQGLASASAGC
jgi:hypothetical protein